MISVIAVDFHSGVFREILEDSLSSKAHSNVPYELLIHDNGIKDNIGHGKGVEKLIRRAKYNNILVLDIDAHMLLQDWNLRLKETIEKKWPKGVRLIAGEGGQLKPVRPCVMLFQRDYFIKNEMTFQARKLEGAKFDVGVLLNFQVLSRGDKVEYFKYAKRSYPETIGNDYTMNGEPFIFHHWYGTRWYNIAGKIIRDEIDSLTREKFEQSRDSMVKQYGEKNK